MDRTIEFEEDLVCDCCGEKGAYDFMGDALCSKCIEVDDAGSEYDYV